MFKLFADRKTIKSRLLSIIIFSLLLLCTVANLSAEDDIEDEFPWVIFYPAFFKKAIDIDNDGFSVRQGDCNDNDSNVFPGANEICGDEVDQDCDGNDLQCSPPCANIAGDWLMTETTSVTLCIDGDCQSETVGGTDTITFQQDGCNISYSRHFPGLGTFARTGSIDGNNYHYTGIFLVRMPNGCTATKNVFDVFGTVNGDQINGTGSGIAEGTCGGSFFINTGESTQTGTRSRFSSTHNALSGTDFDRKPSATFSKDGKIFSVMVH